MTLLCRLGWHDWGRWQQVNVVTTHLVRSIIGHRMPDQDFRTTHTVQRRECRRCGRVQQT